MQTQYDVIILGAGIVGLVAANLCAQQNLTVALVDRQLPVGWRLNQRDIRCLAITRRSQNILKSIGVWENIAERRLSAYRHMEVWDALSTGSIRFDAETTGETELGHIIENTLIVQMLWEKLQEKENVICFVSANPVNFKRESEYVTLQLEDGRTLSAALLVGADGAQSWLRQAADISTQSLDYGQDALVATIETEQPHQATARQCFLEDGVLAFLPLNEAHLSSIVWSTDKAKSNVLLNLDEQGFCEELAYAFDYRLGKIIKIGERRSFPLYRQHAARYIESRVALVGDAAHVIHPLAGQGVNLGIYDAEVLASVLKEAKSKGYDIGHALLLRRYERARKGHNQIMMAGMGFFKQIFALDNSLLQGIRGFGMNLVNSSKWLKTRFIREAMGL